MTGDKLDDDFLSGPPPVVVSDGRNCSTLPDWRNCSTFPGDAEFQDCDCCVCQPHCEIVIFDNDFAYFYL
jgi:hypothetical protein